MSLKRREFIKKSAMVSAGATLAAASTSAIAADEKPHAGKKALFVYGGWDGHQPVQCRDLFMPWLKEEGFEVEVSDTLDSYLDADLMGSRDLIVQIFTMSQISNEQLKGLLKAVRDDGCGISGWHGGLGDAFRQATEYQFMVGGQWVAHPGGVIPYRVNITDHEDPITRGLKDFDLNTEQYYMHTDPNNKVLATTTFSAEHASWIDGATMPICWKRVYGKGRVFYSSLGHTVDVYDTPEALAIQKRGTLWASNSKHEETPDLVSPVYPSR